MKSVIRASLAALLFPVLAFAQNVSVSGTKFYANGSQIFMNGVNTPWHAWNDFGGSYDSSWWNAEFQRIKAAGGNCTRVWITCNGEVGVLINSDGTVTGVNSTFWSNLDDFFTLARNNQIYIMATLMSFDHVADYHTNYQSWRNMFASQTAVQSFVNNYAVPFVNRYKSNPYLFAIDAINEPEWANQNASDGNVPWNQLQYYVARVADAVHANSSVLVTVGSAAVKWNSSVSPSEANYWSDSALQAQYGSSRARLDFYSPHFYGWVVQYFGDFALNKSPTDYGLTDRPCMVGENPATGVYNNTTVEVASSQMYLGAYAHGWQGLCAWSSNGVDSYGSLSDCQSGLANFKSTYPNLVAGSSGGGGGTGAKAECESGTLTNCSTATSLSGYSGAGYVNGSTFVSGSKVSNTVSITTGGQYTLHIRYASPWGDKYQDVYVNGNYVGNIKFPSSSTWADLNIASVNFVSGNNTIEIRASWGWSNLDYVEIVGAGGSGGGGGGSSKAESESASLTACSTANSLSGYSGTGYVDGTSFTNGSGSSITHTISVSSGGSHTLHIRYACPWGDKYQDVYVNGNYVGNIKFPSSATWADVNISNVNFTSGNNTVKISASWGWTNFDYVEEVN